MCTTGQPLMRRRPPTCPMPEPIAVLNLVDSALSSLAKKGNLRYATELYNPGNAFARVHHISFFSQDRGIDLANPSIQVHVIWTARGRVPIVWPVIDVIGGLLQILWIARKYRVSLIRGRGAHAAAFYGVLVSRLLRIPLVVSIGAETNRMAWELGGKYPILGSRVLSHFVEEVAVRGASMVFTPNRHNIGYLTGLGVRPERIRVVPLRILNDIFDPSFPDSTVLADHGVRLDRPIVLYVGRLAQDKSVDLVVEAMPHVLRERPDAQFVIVGDGVLRPMLERRVAELGLGTHVFFLGYQNSDAIKYCMARATAIWIPKTGFVIFEAAAMSMPIVAFDVEWQSEFVTDGETGLLAPYRDVEAFARGAVRLIQDPALARRVGAGARARVEADFSPASIIARELACYRELVGDFGAPA
jgi:glycosyltransferase involved in cell wall biosynthesis